MRFFCYFAERLKSVARGTSEIQFSLFMDVRVLQELHQRRGSSTSLKIESSSSHKCICNCRSKDYFCSSLKCRNDQQLYRPAGSVTVGRVGTDEGSPRSTRSSRRTVAPSQPKPEEAGGARPVRERIEQHSDLKDDAKFVNIEESNPEKVLKQLKGDMVNTESSTSSEMLEALKLAAKTLERETRDKFWTTDAGQTELLRRLEGSAGNRLHRRHRPRRMDCACSTTQPRRRRCSARPAR